MLIETNRYKKNINLFGLCYTQTGKESLGNKDIKKEMSWEELLRILTSSLFKTFGNNNTQFR